MMLVRNVLNRFFRLLPITHPHEQIVYIESGRCEFTVDREKINMGPGDLVVIPQNVVHDASVIGDEPAVNFDFFSPVREDFIEAFSQFDK